MLLFGSLGELEDCETRARLREGKIADYEEVQADFPCRPDTKAECTLIYNAEQDLLSSSTYWAMVEGWEGILRL